MFKKFSVLNIINSCLRWGTEMMDSYEHHNVGYFIWINNECLEFNIQNCFYCHFGEWPDMYNKGGDKMAKRWLFNIWSLAELIYYQM